MNAINDELEKNRTVLCITHQLCTVKDADDILFFAGGKLSEQGTYTELASKTGIFNKGPLCEHEDGGGVHQCKHCIAANFAAFHMQQDLGIDVGAL